jgi:hypothetical protein
MPLAAVVILISTTVLNAQRSYGPRVWWDAGQGGFLGWDEAYDNPDGQVGLVNKKGAIRTDGHPFFEPLGENRRACVTCHQPANAMSISAATLRERWNESQGKDPVFSAVDGSNCPDLPQGERSSHSLLLDRGLFRIALPWPPKNKPDFRIEVVRDPTGCNTGGIISVYRRPRITANLDGTTLMADGREPSLESQAINAILIHQQAKTSPASEQIRRIIEFESQVHVAQSADIRGGLLSGSVNGPLSPGAFELWLKPHTGPESGLQREFRASVARGSDVFLKDCARCHPAGATPWMDIGTTNTTPADASPDLPLFRITCDSGRVVYTQDPGRALISGKCADAGAIVVQQLRGLAARAPYFSNGSARTLRDVVDFYDRRFAAGYTEREKTDLVNFLRVL